MPGARGEDADWIEPMEDSFWWDAAWAFGFFLDTGNLITLVVIILLHIVVSALASVPFLGCMALGPRLALAAWLCAFYFNVISEAARGERELPAVWVTTFWDDLFLPFLRFIGTWLLVLLPAGVAQAVRLAYEIVPAQLVWFLAGLGLFFWPVFVLGTAIGEGLPILAAPKLIHTVVRTFVPYLLVVLLVGLAAALPIGFRTGVDRLLVGKMTAGTPSSSLLTAVWLIGEAITAYAWIVAMQLIGLYYRHFNRRFPWAAE